ncbi:MAG: hypothetical protein WCK14_08185 [Actinomycetota bacterium]
MKLNWARPQRLVVSLLVLALVGCGGSSSKSATPTSGRAVSIVGSGVCQAALDISGILKGVDLTSPAGIKKLPDAIARLADVVPTELDADVATLSAAVSSFVAVLERFNFDIAAVEADATANAELEGLTSTEAQAAAEHIQTWLADQCA